VLPESAGQVLLVPLVLLVVLVELELQVHLVHQDQLELLV
jgi:hypothetical protein